MTFLIVAALLGLIPAFIAQSKGRSFAGWWVYGFLLFIVAIIHVLIIPTDTVASLRIPEARSCPFCAEPIHRKAIKCKHCGSEVIALSGGVNGDESTEFSWKRLFVFALAAVITGIIINVLGLS